MTMREQITAKILECVDRDFSYLPDNFSLPSNSMEPAEFYESYATLDDEDIEKAIDDNSENFGDLVLDNEAPLDCPDFWAMVDTVQADAVELAMRSL
jgi:hypothetical protein